VFEPFSGLSGHPFERRPDASFFFPSRAHQHAYRRLQHGLHHGGITVLTGEAGAGKTITVEAFLGQLADPAIVARKLDCTGIDRGAAWPAILDAFGDEPAARGRRRLLVLDEAQALPLECWRELHRLPLQLFLVGRPELRQRVQTSCHLGCLGEDETRAYIAHRLRRVGWKGELPFDQDAFAVIHDLAGGIPGRINLLCSRALTATFVGEKAALSAGALRALLQAL
jgi:type II secretory pathway predicted ATPase ExeA